MLDEIREALRTRDSKLLERAAHTLKGSAENFAMSGRGKPLSGWSLWQNPANFPVPKIFFTLSNSNSHRSIRLS